MSRFGGHGLPPGILAVEVRTSGPARDDDASSNRGSRTAAFRGAAASSLLVGNDQTRRKRPNLSEAALAGDATDPLRDGERGLVGRGVRVEAAQLADANCSADARISSCVAGGSKL